MSLNSPTNGLRPLSARLKGWPEQAPQYISDLMQTRHGDLKEQLAADGVSPELIAIVLEMRRDTIDAHHSASELPITNAQDAARLLEDRILRPQANKWVTYALGKNRLRLAVPHPSGGREYLRVVSRMPPTVEELNTAPLPSGGVYLVIYGGSPEILGATSNAEKIAQLRKTFPISDVLFYNLIEGQSPTLFSLEARCGDQGGDRREFPNREHLITALGEEKA